MLAKLKNVPIILLCYLFFLKRGSAKKLKVTPPKTVLVVQLAWLGDMICTTPLFRAIKQKYPGCRVVVLGTKRNVGILDGNIDVDRYIAWSGGIHELIAALNSERIDFSCLVTPSFSALAGLFLLGIPVIAAPEIKNGWSPYETLSYRMIRQFVISVPHKMGSYAYQEYLRMIEPIGIFSDDTTKHLFCSKEASSYVETFILESGVSSFRVAISPSTGNKIKNWKPDRFAKIADYLIERYGAKIFVIGTEGDKKEVEEMMSFSKHKEGIINTINAFSLEQLKAFISKMDLFISVDTGPIYIAEAFNVPTIDILGAVGERELGPRGDIHRLVYDKSRKFPILHVMNTRVYNAAEAQRQIDSITVEMVIEAVDDLIGYLNVKNKNGQSKQSH
jgi:ADP-heptose:LPS heptosyltransferase